MTAMTVVAQELLNKTWTNGDVQYTGEREGRVIHFEGYDDHEGGFFFSLGEPVKGKRPLVEKYKDYGYGYYYDGGTAEYKRLNGQELLIIRDKKGKLTDVLVVGTYETVPGTKTAVINSVSRTGIPGKYPFTSIRVMIWKELAVFTLDELDIMRNEIFARHGHTFKTAKYRDYFNAQSWYEASVNDASNRLTEIEQLNVEQIVRIQNFKRNAS